MSTKAYECPYCGNRYADFDNYFDHKEACTKGYDQFAPDTLGEHAEWGN